MPNRRRDDYPEEDHRKERDPDWKVLAPRWLLVTTIAVLTLTLGAAIGHNSALDDDRIKALEAYRNDQRWDMLAKLSETQAMQGVQLRQHEQQLQQLTRAIEEISQVRNDIRAVRRVIEREAAEK